MSIAIGCSRARRWRGARPGQPGTSCSSAAPTQKPLSHPRLQCAHALGAKPLRLALVIGPCGHGTGAVRCIPGHILGLGQPVRRTLMRHGSRVLGAEDTLFPLTRAPPSRTFSMLGLPSNAALISPPSVTLALYASRPGTHLAAIELASVATPTQHNLHTTANTQKHATNVIGQVPPPTVCQSLRFSPSTHFEGHQVSRQQNRVLASE